MAEEPMLHGFDVWEEGRLSFPVRYLIVAAMFCAAIVVVRLLNPLGRPSEGVPRWTVQLVPAAAVALLVWLTLWFVEWLLNAQFLAGGAEENAKAESLRWGTLYYFLAMVAGMVAQTIWHALQNRQLNVPPAIDKWEFLKPALVAPIVFVSVYQNIAQSAVTIAMLLFSFQNGFFWQTVLRSNTPKSP